MSTHGHVGRPMFFLAFSALPLRSSFCVLHKRSNDAGLGCSIAIVIRGDLTMAFKFREPSASPLQRHFPTVLNITALKRGTPAVPVKLSIPIEFSIGSYRLTKTKYRI